MSGRTSATTPRRRRLLWQVLIGLVLGAALLGILFLRIDFARFTAAFSRLSPWYIVAALLLRLAAVVLRSARWQRLGVTHPRATLTDCLSATVNGFLIGLVVPGLCEFTRAYIVKRRAQVPFGAVLSVLVVERVVDAVFLLAVIFLVLVFQPGVHGLLVPAVAIGAVLAVGIAMLVVFVAARERSVRRIERTVSRVWPRAGARLAGFVSNVADGLHQLARLHVQRILVVFGLTAAFWLAHALRLPRVPGFRRRAGARVLRRAVCGRLRVLGMIMTFTPLGLGQYQLIVVAVLAIFGVGASAATSVSLVLHGVRLLASSCWACPFWRGSTSASPGSRWRRPRRRLPSPPVAAKELREAPLREQQLPQEPKRPGDDEHDEGQQRAQRARQGPHRPPRGRENAGLATTAAAATTSSKRGA